MGEHECNQDHAIHRDELESANASESSLEIATHQSAEGVVDVERHSICEEVLHRKPLDEAEVCFGHWVLAEAAGCPVTVGLLRKAQSSKKIKLVTMGGQVVFF